MIEFYIGMTVLTVTSTFLFSFVDRSWFAVLVPCLCLMWFGAVTYVPNYMGYAIPFQLVQDREAFVTAMTTDHDWIYAVVQFEKDPERRMVKLPNNDKNKKSAEKVQKQLTEGGIAVVKFGQGMEAKDSGETADQGSQGNGQQGDQQGHSDSKGADFELLDPQQSQLMKKGN